MAYCVFKNNKIPHFICITKVVSYSALRMLTFSRFSHYFIEVARQGSLRKAAETLNVSASAIDRQILLAEEELGTVLFERLPSGLRLTSAGELLLNDLKRWSKEFSRTLQRFDELQDIRRGHVSIGMINALTDGAFIDSIARIGEEYPGLTFDLSVVDSQVIPQLVQSLEVDFGLVLDPVGLSGMDIRPLAKIPMGVVLPVGHELANEKKLSLGQILAYRQIVPAQPLTLHHAVERLYMRHQAHDKIQIHCNSVRAIRSLIQQNAGISILGWLDVAPDVAAGKLVFIPLHDRQIKPMVLSLCIAPQRQLSRAAQIVIEKLSKDLSTYLSKDYLALT